MWWEFLAWANSPVLQFETISLLHGDKNRLDMFTSFNELLRQKQENRDFKRNIVDRSSSIVVVAPHGGGIEPGTSEIARAIAGDDYSLYVFEGIQSHGNEDLHIKSTKFDDPCCLELLANSDVALTIHGCLGETHQVFVGGRNNPIISRMVKALNSAGFEAIRDDTGHSGTFTENICNKCSSREGVQLEITELLRKSLFRSLTRRGRKHPNEEFINFVSVLRDVIGVSEQ